MDLDGVLLRVLDMVRERSLRLTGTLCQAPGTNKVPPGPRHTGKGTGAYHLYVCTQPRDSGASNTAELHNLMLES